MHISLVSPLCTQKNPIVGIGGFSQNLQTKGQLISKATCKVVNYSKKRTNEFVFTTMRHVFFCFLEEIEDTKKAFRN